MNKYKNILGNGNSAFGLKNTIIEFSNTGICKIDIDKTLKIFDRHFYLDAYNKCYILSHVDLKLGLIARIMINMNDGQHLIQQLNLTAKPHYRYKNLISYKR